MAELTPPIPARTQLLAVAWLRWRIFVNNTFRRPPEGSRQAFALVFAILLRVILWPILALMAVGPILAAGLAGWAAIAHNDPQSLIPLLAAITVLWQFISVNGLSIAANLSSFDPASLARFPLRFGRYLVLRILLGLLTLSTIVGCLALLAAAIGIGIAKPALAAPALAVLAVTATMNIFLTRMLGAWFERWLAVRRFREIFSGVMLLLFAGMQLLETQHGSGHSSGAGASWLLVFLRGQHPYLRWLPPGFAANAILSAARPLAALAQFAGLLAWTALFLWIFSIRLRKQYLGEYLSDGSRTGMRTRPRLDTPAHDSHPSPIAVAASRRDEGHAALPPVMAACLRKEWLTLRGNNATLIAMLTPLVFVLILNRGTFARHPAFFLPGALAYVLVGFVGGFYNIFGSDGAGVQTYLLAPIRLRDVIVAKNIAGLVLVVAEVSLAWAMVAMLSGAPIPWPMRISTLLWTVFVVAANLALGTVRSIQAPRKFIPGQTAGRRGTPTNRTSGWLVLGVLFGSLLLQIPVVLLGRQWHAPWIGALVFAPLATAAVGAYALVLRHAEKLVRSHRDVLSEELCKA